MKQTQGLTHALTVDWTGQRRVTLVLACAVLAMTAVLLGACGAPAAPTAAPATEAPTLEPEPTTAPPTEAATEAPSATAAATEAPTEAPRPTTAAVVPTAAAAASAAPTTVPVATVVPASAWSVEFYPDNWTYQLEKDQLCAGVNWKSVGVTDLVFGAKDSSGEKVEAEGRRSNLCFGEDEAEFFLEYRKPDGQLERKTVKLERDN